MYREHLFEEGDGEDTWHRTFTRETLENIMLQKDRHGTEGAGKSYRN